jgi:phosphatidate cytidylyltransferase
MLRTRLLVGSLLVGLAVGILAGDVWLARWTALAPFLLLTCLAGAVPATLELVSLLPPPAPRAWLCALGVAVVLLANWPAHLTGAGDPWHWVLGALTGVLMGLFLWEAAWFQGPGGAVRRVSLAFWCVAYLGLLASFLVQLRWLPGGHGSAALALAIFVPKCGDIGAYFTGTFLGRHRMAPLLSPKKTWEGAAGGLTGSLGAALAIRGLEAYLAPGVPLLTWPGAVAFGLVVGAVAQLGDLMESLIKRDCERKDASHLLPGFGGVLDVLDSVLFSAPVAYWWLRMQPCG